MEKEKNNKFSRFVKEYNIIPPIIIFLFVLGFRTYVVDFSLVSGESMLPSLQNNQTLILNRTNKKPKRGEVINFYSKENNPTAQPGHDVYVKRVIGVPGDTVELKNGELLVNGKIVNQEFLNLDSSKIDAKEEANFGSQYPIGKDWDLKTLSNEVTDWNSFSKGKEVVPEGCYFVLGDHRSNSVDSRSFGFVKESSILGVVRPNPFKNSRTDYFLTKHYVDNFFKK